MSSWYQPRPGRAPRTSPGARMAGSIAALVTSDGNECVTDGRSHPVRLRLCSAPTEKPERCGPRMSVASTVPMMAGKPGTARSFMPHRRSTYAVSPWCSNPRPSDVSTWPLSVSTVGAVIISASPRWYAKTAAADAQSTEERGTWHSATIRVRRCQLLFARADSR